VRENILLGAYAVKQPRRELDRRLRGLLELFPSAVTDRLKVPAGSLSGGEQQLVAVARALIANPKVVILDEPSLGLAPLLAKTILKIVRGFADDGVAVLVVEQNARQALSVADRAYVLETGRVALEGRAKDLAADERVQKAYLGGFETIAKEQEASEAAG